MKIKIVPVLFFALFACQVRVQADTMGAVQVTIVPAAAITNGAQWAVDDSSWLDSGTVVSNLTTGSHLIIYHDASGFVAPSGQTVTVVPGQTTNVTATYIPLGNLTVTIVPAAAITNGAQWAVDDGSWLDSGTVVSNLSLGTHTIIFQSASGFIAPSGQTVAVVSGQTTNVTATYTDAPVGNVSVTIVPAGAVTNGAQWAVDGGLWQTSGATVSNLSLGSHSIIYYDAIGFITPGGQTVTVVMGQTTNVTATYTPLGNVTVTIVPDGAITNGAQWAVDGVSWQNSGSTVSNLSLGNHSITYRDVVNFVTPASQTVTLVSGQTTNVTATYIPFGNLSVTINPDAAITNGAQWAVDNGFWQNSGSTVSNLTTGSHLIIYHDASGFVAPSGQTVTVVPGQTTNVTATYIPLGNLTVTIVPAAAITNGAQWAVDDGSWLDSGTVVSNLSLGTHTIIFQSASGFIAPSGQTVAVVSGQTTNVTATYSSVVLLENVLAQPGNSFAFNCQVTAGLTFQVQFKTNLSQTSWSDLGPSIYATNAMTPFVDTSATDGQRFYRVQILQ